VPCGAGALSLHFVTIFLQACWALVQQMYKYGVAFWEEEDDDDVVCGRYECFK
jgi:hypothetical protein